MKKKPTNFNINVTEPGRKPSRKEIRAKTNVGFAPEYQIPWTEKVGWSRKYEEGYERIFGKKGKKTA